jgi:hypothetical protein
VVPTSGIFEAVDPLSYPNPYYPVNPGGVNVTCTLTQSAAKVSLKIYTASFRLVLVKEWNGDFSAGRFEQRLSSYELARLSAGVYYYVIAGERKTGEKARTKPGVMVVLKHK